MQYNGKIDVIIPIYNVSDKLLFTSISSVACQSIVSDVKITIVDDGSTIQNYQKVINSFKNFLDIQVLRYKNNQGPGFARQYAINHTKNEYIVFLDSDDTFSNSYCLQFLRQNMENNKNCVLGISDFEEVKVENNILKSIRYTNTLLGIAGKIYRRDFLKEYNIHFHPTLKANEDSYFNRLIKLYAGNERILSIDSMTYYYNFNPKSLSREEGWFFKRGFNGFVEGAINFIQIAQKDILKININNLYEALSHDICVLYVLYIQCFMDNPNMNSFYLNLCKKYYKYFSLFENQIPLTILTEAYQGVLTNGYQDVVLTFIPPFSFNEFLQMIKED